MIIDGDNIFVGIEVDPKTAKTLALPGGEPADELHITLALLEPMYMFNQVVMAVQHAASCHQDIVTNTQGIARFNVIEGEPDAFVLLLDGAQGLCSLQDCIDDCLEDGGMKTMSNYEFIPHITLQYLSESMPLPVQRFSNRDIPLNNIVVGDADRRVYIPLSSENMNITL